MPLLVYTLALLGLAVMLNIWHESVRKLLGMLIYNSWFNELACNIKGWVYMVLSYWLFNVNGLCWVYGWYLDICKIYLGYDPGWNDFRIYFYEGWVFV